MANASLAEVYNRLNGVAQYHPFSANTFADWASEAGDTVKISQNGTQYSAPVHKQSLVWRGKHELSMESTGTRERTAIERVSNSKETTTSSGVSSSRAVTGGAGSSIQALQYDFYDPEGKYESQLYMDEQRFTTIFTKTGIDGLPEGTSLSTMINQNAEQISLEAIRAYEQETLLSGRITVEAGRITQEVTNRENKDNELQGKITVEANRITQEVTDRRGDVEALSGRIIVQANRITQIVNAVGSDGTVTAASIVLAINAAGESEAQIDANKVYIGNSKSTTVINGKLNATDFTTDSITTKLALATNVNVRRLSVTNNGYIVLPTGDGTVSITGASAVDFVKNLRIQLTGNTYKLQKVTLGDASWQDVGSFSRAVSSWSVGGGSGKVNVTANPQNQTKSVPVSIGGPNSISSNGTYTYKVYYENADGDDVETGASRTVTVNVSGTSQRVDDIDLGEIAVSSYPPTGYEDAVLLTQLPNAIKNNQNTYVWFKVKALDQNGHSLYTKNYYCASA